jgi:hypothetical protein
MFDAVISKWGMTPKVPPCSRAPPASTEGVPGDLSPAFGATRGYSGS